MPRVYRQASATAGLSPGTCCTQDSRGGQPAGRTAPHAEARGPRSPQVFANPDAFLQSRGLAPLRGPLSVVNDSMTGWSKTAQRRLQQIDGDVLQPVSYAFPGVDVRWDLSRVEGLGYYRGPCVRITAEDATGLRLPLVDGGYTDWMARLLQDPNERMLSTGMGPDLAALRFRRDATTPG